MTLEDLLIKTVENEASDLHITVGTAPRIRKAGSSCGAIIQVRAKGVPVGLGAPIYSKLDMDLASAMMSINAVKGVNIGSGMNSAQLTGEQNSDEISQIGKKTN